MRLIHLLTVPAAAGAIVLLGMSAASAGEAQGNSSAGNINETGMRGHANSICAFSGQNPERFLDPSDPRLRARSGAELGPDPKQTAITRPGRVIARLAHGSDGYPGDSGGGALTGFLAGGGGEPGALTGSAGMTQRAASPRVAARCGPRGAGRAQWWA